MVTIVRLHGVIQSSTTYPHTHAYLSHPLCAVVSQDAEEGGAGNGDTRRKHRFNGTGDTLVEEDEEGGQDDGAPVGTLTQHEDDDLDFDPEDDSSSQMAVTCVLLSLLFGFDVCTARHVFGVGCISRCDSLFFVMCF